MSEVINVKWHGKHIAEDSTHRLVTDEQINRYNLAATKVVHYNDDNLIFNVDSNTFHFNLSNETPVAYSYFVKENLNYIDAAFTATKNAGKRLPNKNYLWSTNRIPTIVPSYEFSSIQSLNLFSTYNINALITNEYTDENLLTDEQASQLISFNMKSVGDVYCLNKTPLDIADFIENNDDYEGNRIEDVFYDSPGISLIFNSYYKVLAANRSDTYLKRLNGESSIETIVGGYVFNYSDINDNDIGIIHSNHVYSAVPQLHPTYIKLPDYLYLIDNTQDNVIEITPKSIKAKEEDGIDSMSMLNDTTLDVINGTMQIHKFSALKIYIPDLNSNSNYGPINISEIKSYLLSKDPELLTKYTSGYLFTDMYLEEINMGSRICQKLHDCRDIHAIIVYTRYSKSISKSIEKSPYYCGHSSYISDIIDENEYIWNIEWGEWLKTETIVSTSDV